jgi:hypothetical protein
MGVLCMFSRWFLPLAVTPFIWLPTFAQPVISARAGLIQLTDGSVFLDDERLEQRAAKFNQMQDGSELRTQDGRAEVLLTPGMFLRIGGNSAVRMISNRLMDTRVRLLNGSAIVDAVDASPNTPVTIIYSDYLVRIGQQGRYRFDTNPPELKVDEGEAKVLMDGRSLVVHAGYLLPFSTDLVARRFGNGAVDGLDDWSASRQDSISRNNLDAANTSDLSGVIDDWQNDRAAYLQALGMSSYLPPLPLSAYNPTIGSPLLGMTPFGLYGMGYGNPLGLYPLLLSGYYGPAYSVYGINRLRNPIPFPPYRFGTGYRPGSIFGTSRIPAAAPIRVGVPRPAAVHVGAGHR